MSGNGDSLPQLRTTSGTGIPPDGRSAPAHGTFDVATLHQIAPGMFDALGEAIAVVARDRSLIAANRRYLEVFGTRGGGGVGSPCEDVLHCPEHSRADSQGQRCVACQAMDEGRVRRVIRSVPDAAGVSHRWEASFSPIANDRGEVTHVVEVWRDISERSALEAQLAHGERLASVGLLAAGVGHEINNPLASVLAAAESLERLLQRGVFTGETCSEALDLSQILQREVLRCRETTAKLMLLAQPVSSAAAWVDLNRAVRDTVSLLQFPMRNQNITLEDACAPDLPPIWARESALGGVCMNLMLNAVQAMPEGGVLRVSTLADSGRVHLVVEDTGPGIELQHLERIWDPFFTTKSPGKGTGLGLSVTHGIVTRHRGTVRASNREEGGARFEVELPIEGPAEA